MNEFFNKIKTQSTNIEGFDCLEPTNISENLKNVKRSNRKKTIIALTSVGLCLCLLFTSGIFSNGFFTLNFFLEDYPINTYVPQNIDSQIKSPNDYSKIYEVVGNLKKEQAAQNSGELYKDSDLNNDAGVRENLNEYESESSDFGYGEDSSVQITSDSLTTDDYSETNVQVSGVDEADIIKTDGNYIYSFYSTENYNSLNIAKVKDGKIMEISKTNLDFLAEGMYIYNDLIIFEETVYDDYDYYGAGICDSLYPYSGSCASTTIHIYNVSNKQKPTLSRSLSLDGGKVSTRVVGSTLYLVTNYNIYDLSGVKKNSPETYVPKYQIINPNATSDSAEEDCINPNDIVICGSPQSISYVNVASIDLTKPNKFAQIKSVLAGGNEVYCNLNNLFIAVESYNEEGYSKTKIVKCSLNGTSLKFTAEGEVSGYLLNQFSMDEYNNYFRIVTSSYDSKTYQNSTRVYVLDKNLKIVGKTPNVGENEDLKSVRFDGNYCYFVTFRNTDPLFAADLSNPNNPVILSELKIPGFSEYLHPFGEGLLFGFGQEADESDGATMGLKLSMFNISDKTNVKEITTNHFAKTKHEDSYYYANAEAEYNHKAMFVNVEKSLIGFSYHEEENYYTYNESENQTTSYEQYGNYYVVFKYENGEFKQMAKINLDKLKQSYKDKYFQDEYEYEYLNYDIRGLYIGDYFYISSGRIISSYKLSDFAPVDSVCFD